MKKITFLIMCCIIHAGMSAQDWSLTGNAGTKPSTNFIGTTDAKALKIRTNNKMRITIDSSGNVGIGKASPSSKFDVAGAITGFDSYFGKTYQVSAGTSGASYSSVGYGLTFTDTTANYRYRLNDFSSMLSFRSGGFDFNTAPNGIAGDVIPYTPVMTIQQNGNVGIGTTAPVYKLHVASSSPPVALIESTGGSVTIMYVRGGSNTQSGPAFIAFQRPDHNIIGAIYQTTAFSVSYTTTSDKRLKNIIGASQKGLSDLMKINIYDYTFKSDPARKVQTGFMAQELYEIFPQAVTKPRDNNKPAEKDPWMVDYGSVTPLIIKAVQELSSQNEKLKKQNDDLEKKYEAQQKQIDELKAIFFSGNQQSPSNGQQVILTSPNGGVEEALEQNIPNPFNHSTTINYTLPQQYSSARIVIIDVLGKVLKEINVSGYGKGSLSVDVSMLSSGTYQYSLYVDGRLIDTKRMILAK